MKSDDIVVAPILVGGVISGLRVNGEDLTVDQIQIFKEKCQRAFSLSDALFNARSVAVVLKETW